MIYQELGKFHDPSKNFEIRDESITRLTESNQIYHGQYR